jgi:GTPase SAR1 family protein
VEQCPSSVSVILVGNKIDQAEDRMVTHEEGERRSRELGCDQFREISVREQVDVPRNVVEQLYTHWKHGHHAVKFIVNRCLLDSDILNELNQLVFHFISKLLNKFLLKT